MVTYVGDALMAHAKAGCYRCGRGSHLVDMDAQIEGEGALVLCRGCLGDASQAAGIHHNAAEWAELRATVLSLEAEVARAQETERRFNAYIEAARDFDPADFSEAEHAQAPEEPESCGAPTVSGNPCRHTLRNGMCPSHGAPLLVVR